MNFQKILSIILVLLMVIGCMSISASANGNESSSELGVDSNSDKSLDQNYKFTQKGATEYTDTVMVKLEWSISDIAATYRSHQTWDYKTLSWVEVKENIQVADQVATFKLTNYSSKNMKANVAFTVEESVKKTYDAENSTFDNNDCVVETPVEHNTTKTYTEADFIAKQETITATLKFTSSAFVSQDKKNEVTQYGVYTITISEDEESSKEESSEESSKNNNPYLTFSSDVPFTLSPANTRCLITGLQSSTDTNTWTDFYGNYRTGSTSVEAVKNTSDNQYYVYLRGKGLTSLYYFDDDEPFEIRITIEEGHYVDCSGNIMNLLDYENPSDVEMSSYTFNYLFHDCSALRTAPSLPAMTLASYCYANMFSGCTSLTLGPSLPATTLAESCYQQMFAGCTSLTSAPYLPAENLETWCYEGMFNFCTSLKIGVCTDPDIENKIFTCPNSGDAWNPVSSMFQNTDSSLEIKTPTEGNTYYWYTE